MVGVALVAAWLSVLRLPGWADLAALGVGALGAVLLVFGLAMGLAWVGFGLFAAGDRVAGWLGRLGSWPEDDAGGPGAS